MKNEKTNGDIIRERVLQKISDDNKLAMAIDNIVDGTAFSDFLLGGVYFDACKHCDKATETTDCSPEYRCSSYCTEIIVRWLQSKAE